MSWLALEVLSPVERYYWFHLSTIYNMFDHLLFYFCITAEECFISVLFIHEAKHIQGFKLSSKIAKSLQPVQLNEYILKVICIFN